MGSKRRTENASTVATANPPAKKAADRRLQLSRQSGYVIHRGATTSETNFVHPERARKNPRLNAELASQKPKIRKAGWIASFVFELETYWVNG